MKKTVIISILLGAFALSACGGGGVGKVLGVQKRAPNEFNVSSRAPLILPPDFEVRPEPEKTAMDEGGVLSPEQQVKQTVFGINVEKKTDALIMQEQASGKSQSELFLLEQTGALGVDGKIRETVDLETSRLAKENENFLRAMILGNQKYGKELDAEQEYNRQIEAQE